MTPDEARKDCAECRMHVRTFYDARTDSLACLYHRGYADGYEAAQREQIAAAMASLPRTIDAVPHFASETNYGRPGR